MEYEVIIGLEVHSELLTDTKIYCGCSTKFGQEQNTHCCPVCMGLPGALPVLNKRVLEYAIKAGIALNCSINTETYHSRKNYFYPDCPKNYQITQYETPLCSDGYIEISTHRGDKKIGIERIHIEEDAGKAIHKDDGSYIDFNRAGIPLIEIVSRPDMRSAKEATMYLQKLRSILKYIEVSDCKMEEGSLRCDANISIRECKSKNFGVKTEIKNMNSFKAVEKAIEFEVKRHIKAIECGKKIIQETRRWDEEKNETISMRSKEDVHDYRYFPEPDMVCLKIDDNLIEGIKNTIPELPHVKKQRYIKEYSLPEYDVDILTQSRNIAKFFEECIRLGGNPKDISNWIMGEVLRLLRENNLEITNVKFTSRDIVELMDLINKEVISISIAKKVFNYMFESGDKPLKIIKEREMMQLSDEDSIRDIVKNIINENEKSVIDFKNGNVKAIGFLIGQIMKISKGRANPRIANKILNDELNRL